jgi:hypothetical protein
MIRCPGCGEENPPKFRLCGYCGTPLATTAALPAHAAALVLGPGREVSVPPNDRVEVQFPMAAEMASKSPDEHAKFGKADLQVDSRIVDTKAGDTLQIKVRGQGCGILMAFMKP